MNVAKPDETNVLSGAFETARAEFVRRLPLVHLKFEGSEILRQVLVIGGRLVPGSPFGARRVVLNNHSKLLFEMSKRQVHVFNYQGCTTWIDDRWLAGLGAISNLAFDRHRPEPDRLVVLYFEGVGFETSNSHAPYRSTIRGATHGHAGKFLAQLDSHLPFSDTGYGKFSPLFSLEDIFNSEYPEFSHRSRNEADQDWPETRKLYAVALEWANAFMDGLQRSAIDACAAIQSNSTQAFNVFAHENEQIARRRQRAASALPIIGFLCTDWELRYMEGIRDAIDRGLPLIAATAEWFDVPKETVRFLGGKSLDLIQIANFSEGQRFWIMSARALLKALAVIAPKSRPETKSQWRKFQDLVEAFESCKFFTSSMKDRFYRQIGKNGLDKTCETLTRRYGGLWAIRQSREFVECLKQVLANGPHMQEYLDSFVRYQGIRGVLDCSKRWLAATAREKATRLANLGKGMPAFALPFIAPAEIDGLRFVFLNRYSALVEEGIRMSHCVATLYPECRRASRFVFSVRNATDQSLATFDLSIELDPHAKLVVNQLRGNKNDDPSAECRQSVLKFVVEAEKGLRSYPWPAAPWRLRARGKRSTIFESGLNAALEEAKKAALIVALGGPKELKRVLRGTCLEQAKNS